MIIIPCGGKKIESSVPVQAQHLYTGSFFKQLFNVAVTLDSNVRILSAGYGLLRLNDMVVPYNIKMDKHIAKHVAETLERPNEQYIGHLLPKMYLSAIQHFNPVRLIPEVSGMGYFVQEALKLKREVVVANIQREDGNLRQLLEIHR